MHTCCFLALFLVAMCFTYTGRLHLDDCFLLDMMVCIYAFIRLCLFRTVFTTASLLRQAASSDALELDNVIVHCALFDETPLKARHVDTEVFV